MYVLNLTDCESVFLLDLISNLLSETDINPVTGKRELPTFKSIDLRELDPKVLISLRTKLTPYLD